MPRGHRTGVLEVALLPPQPVQHGVSPRIAVAELGEPRRNCCFDPYTVNLFGPGRLALASGVKGDEVVIVARSFKRGAHVVPTVRPIFPEIFDALRRAELNDLGKLPIWAGGTAQSG